ncbi:hypothetical protein FQN54_009638 [Arachnomyces sp. PD_36]|nr:hypothetical protein FQN54_009638 [Arachnomyces sp. PD_36]
MATTTSNPDNAINASDEVANFSGKVVAEASDKKAASSRTVSTGKRERRIRSGSKSECKGHPTKSFTTAKGKNISHVLVNIRRSQVAHPSLCRAFTLTAKKYRERTIRDVVADSTTCRASSHRGTKRVAREFLISKTRRDAHGPKHRLVPWISPNLDKITLLDRLERNQPTPPAPLRT